MKTPKSIAKITRPKMSDIAPRMRLFAQLDDLQSSPVLWITAPGGSGKTTLVGSYLDARKLPTLWYQIDQGDGDLAGFFYYLGVAAKKAAPRYKKALPLLTPEYLMGIPVFTRRFFEILFSRLPVNSVLVLDDYQEVAAHSDFQEMMSQALEVVPEGLRVLILSRSEPPTQMSRLRANRRIAVLGWNDIRFTREESAELLTCHGHPRPAEEILNNLYQRTSGWAAGLVLMTAQNNLADPLSATPPKLTGREVFAYFASEIFERSPDEIQKLLLQTAFLDKIDPAVAVQLSGNSAAGEILERLHRNHYFTQRYEHGYKYHPLFREFLVSRATDTFPAIMVSHLRKETARVLEDSGRVVEAIGLYCDTADWENVERLVLANAQALIAQGRSITVEQWISSIPPRLGFNNPWLTFWLGSCRIHSSPAEATPLFEQAYEQFSASGDTTGRLLSCAFIIDSIVYNWDDYTPLANWIPTMQALLDENSGTFPEEILAPIAISFFSAIQFCHPFRPDIDQRFEQTLSLVRKAGNPAVKMYGFNILSNYSFWCGDVVKLRLLSHEFILLSDVSGQPPLMQIIALWLQALISLFIDTDKNNTLRFIERAIKIGEESGIHAWDSILYSSGVYSALTSGDHTQAHEFLALLHSTLQPAHRNSSVQFHYLSAWLRLNEGNLPQAAAHGETALRIAAETGYYSTVLLCRLELVWIEAARGNYLQAAEQLNQVKQMVDSIRSPAFRFSYLLAAAHISFGINDPASAVDHLKDALVIGRAHDYRILIWWWQPDVMAQLCSRALENGIETEYVRKLIARHHLPPPSTSPSEAWPWPVRITTLGRFEVQVDGNSIDLTGKRKMLEMLKALIALGGDNVSDELIKDLLWPDAEGDDAHNAFKMTLSRLRRMLPDEALTFKDGLISLNRTMMWVDVWGFEHLYVRAAKLWEAIRDSSTIGKKVAGEAILLTEKALDLYGGHFMINDMAQPWAVSTRERLRTNLLWLISHAGRYHEQKLKWKTAAAYYYRGIEADRLQEEFYQRLMSCHIHLGNRIEGLAAYNRCRAELAMHLSIIPSQKTEALRAALLA
jgi:two-component SAPR family response regulator